jgi:predicted MPP superfamily phosphohydrolase
MGQRSVERSQRPRGLAPVAAVAAGLGAACVAYGALVERDWHKLRHETVPVLAPGSDPLTVLHLSDLHMTRSDRRQREFLGRLAEEPADLVVVTGDMLGEPEAIPVVLGTLGRFHPRLGAVAVLGSNDYYPPRPKNYLGYFLPRRKLKLRGRNPWQDLVSGLDALGWQVLSNARGRIGDVELAGIDDGHINRDDGSVPAPPNGPARLRLGIVHSPYLRSLDAFERNGYRLVLAGHTHGGQVRIPGVGALVTNCDLPRGQARGLSRYGTSYLHVSAGLGTSKYARFRFACRPEASLLRLVPGTA